MVCLEGHQDARRDCATSVSFLVDEVFQEGESITRFTWPSRSPAGLHGTLLELPLYVCHVGVGHVQDSGDVRLEDPMCLHSAQHAEDLERARSCPKIPVTNLPDQVIRPLHPLWSEGVNPPQDLSHYAGHGRCGMRGMHPRRTQRTACVSLNMMRLTVSTCFSVVWF